MERGVVVPYPVVAAAGRLFGRCVILSAADLGVEKGYREICEIWRVGEFGSTFWMLYGRIVQSREPWSVMIKTPRYNCYSGGRTVTCTSSQVQVQMESEALVWSKRVQWVRIGSM